MTNFISVLIELIDVSLAVIFKLCKVSKLTLTKPNEKINQLIINQLINFPPELH